MKSYKLMVFRRVTPAELAFDPEWETIAREQVEQRAKELYRKWKTQTPDWDIDIRHDILITEERAIHPIYCQSSTREYFDQQDDPWRPQRIHIIGDSFSGGGGGMAYGMNSVTYEARPAQVDWHETGHVHPTGWLPHSKKMNPSGNLSEYGGDGFMGLQDKLGTALDLKKIDKDRIRSVTLRARSAEQILSPLEYPVQFAHEEVVNTVILDDIANGMKYHLCTRQQAGPYTYDDWKVIHVYAIKTDASGAFHHVTLGKILPNQSIQLGPNWRVENRESKDGYVKVACWYGDEGLTAAYFPVTVFPDVKEYDFPDEENEGLWYNPDMVGQGFDLHVIKNRNELVMYHYTFNDQESSRRWYIYQGNLDSDYGGLHTEGGSFERPQDASLKKSGRARMYVAENDTWIAFNSKEYGRYAVKVEKLAPSLDHPFSGCWFDPEYQNSGFSIHNVDGDRIVGYFYTQGPPKVGNPAIPGNPNDKNTTQRWYMLDGTAEEGIVYEILQGNLLSMEEVEVKHIGDYSCYQINRNWKCDIDFVDDTGAHRKNVFNLTKLA